MSDTEDYQVLNNTYLKLLQRKIDRMDEKMEEMHKNIQQLIQENVRTQKIDNLENEILSLKHFLHIKAKEEKKHQESERRNVYKNQEIFQNPNNNRVRNSSIETDMNKLVLVAFKGKDWDNHNLNDWLQQKLNLEFFDASWELHENDREGKSRKVVFKSVEHRDYIWNNRKIWKGEGRIWFWDLYLTPEDLAVRRSLNKFCDEQSKLGKKVYFDHSTKYAVIDNIKYVWSEDSKKIVTDTVAEF